MNSKLEEIIFFCMTIFLLVFYIFASQKAKADNEITIEQSGNNVDINIEQIGYSNVVKTWTNEGVDGVNNTIDIRQYKNNGSASDKNTLDLRKVVGDGNTLKLGQGFIVDTSGNMSQETGGEYGDTFAHINVTGDNNNILMQQTTNMSSTGHDYWLHIEGDDNDVYTKQQGGGGHYLNLDIFNDGNDVDVVQKNQGSHTSNISLSGTEPTTINVLQQGWSDQTYNISQNCVTVGGCSISVTQE